MGLFGIFRSRDKPKNGTNGSAYPFMWGYSASGKRVNDIFIENMNDDCEYATIGGQDEMDAF
jgi:hypothetical protein